MFSFFLDIYFLLSLLLLFYFIILDFFFPQTNTSQDSYNLFDSDFRKRFSYYTKIKNLFSKIIFKNNQHTQSSLSYSFHQNFLSIYFFPPYQIFETISLLKVTFIKIFFPFIFSPLPNFRDNFLIKSHNPCFLTSIIM